MAETGAHITAIELDRNLAPFLEENLPNDCVTVVTGDVFRVELNKYVHDREYILVSNLPYNITSLVIRNFFTLKPRPTRRAGDAERSCRACHSQARRDEFAFSGRPTLADVKIVRLIPPESFGRRQKYVGVGTFRLRTGEIAEDQEKKVFRLAKIGFSSRRKHLAGNLANGLKRDHAEITRMLIQLGLQPLVRAQELLVEHWIALTKQLS